MADDPEQQVDPEQKLAEAFELVRQALERATVAAAARGAPVPPQLQGEVDELVQAGVTLLAIASGVTPKEIGERIFKLTMSDEDWRVELDEIRRRASQLPQGS